MALGLLDTALLAGLIIERGKVVGSMAVDVTKLLTLPKEERVKLAEALMEGTAPPDIGTLLRDFVTSLERTTRALELAIARLSALDERLARGRAEVREAVLGSGEAWPFPLA
jgi:hypothetical protein